MLTMDYRMVDVLNADQLEAEDLIGIGNEVVKIINVDSTDDGFVLLIENDFGERELINIFYDEKFELFVLD